MPRPLPPDLESLLRRQDGVVVRRQLLDHGVTDATTRRWLRRRDLTTILPGVHVDHTGAPTWRQRAWAAVLYAAPAGLFGASALRAASGPGRRDHDDSGPVHVLVAADRTVRRQPGVVVHRTRRLDEVAQWNASHPRSRVEDAALDVAALARDDFAAFAVLARAIGSRQTTPARLRDALSARSRMPRRAFLEAALDDLLAGACSVIERAYLRDVERAHGLPTADRQVRGSSRGPIHRDVLYRRSGWAGARTSAAPAALLCASAGSCRPTAGRASRSPALDAGDRVDSWSPGDEKSTRSSLAHTFEAT